MALVPSRASAERNDEPPAAILAKLPSKLSRLTTLTPPSLRGDFDGDHQEDWAVLVKDEASGKLGVVILHGGKRRPAVFGAGHDFGNGGDNFDWIDLWSVTKGSAGKADSLHVEKSESASANIRWTGKRYRWVQAGD